MIVAMSTYILVASQVAMSTYILVATLLGWVGYFGQTAALFVRVEFVLLSKKNKIVIIPQF
jgi:hypothetical protein